MKLHRKTSPLDCLCKIQLLRVHIAASQLHNSSKGPGWKMQVRHPRAAASQYRPRCHGNISALASLPLTPPTTPLCTVATLFFIAFICQVKRYLMFCQLTAAADYAADVALSSVIRLARQNQLKQQ